MFIPASPLRSLAIAFLQLFAVVCGGALLQAQAPNTVDPVFGGAGLGLAGDVTKSVLQANGQLLVSGGLRGIVRLNGDGSTDTAFLASTSDFPPDLIAVQPDGKIVLAGYYSQVDGMTTSILTRLNADGTLDTGFNGGADPTVAADHPTALAVQSTGKILVYCGDNLIRLNTDGTRDTGFQAPVFTQPSGFNGTDGAVTVLLVLGDDSILAGGTFNQISGAASSNLAHLHPDGTLDAAYQPTVGGDIFAGALQPNGELVISGNFTTVNGVARNYLARLNADGTLDTTFQSTGEIIPNGVAVAANGQILFEGYDFTAQTYTLERVNADGSLDTAFRVNANNGIETILCQADGSTLVTGPFTQLGGAVVNSVARLLPGGSVDTNYVVDVASGPNQQVFAIAVQADGGVLIGGFFTEINSATHAGVGRLKSDGSLDASFHPGTTVLGASTSVFAIDIQKDGRILVGGDFTQANGATYNQLARLNADGTPDTGFNPNPAGTVAALALQPDGKILLLAQSEASETLNQCYVERLNADGSQDASFNTSLSANGFTTTLALQADGKVLVGGYAVLGVKGQNLIRLNSDGSLDTGFNVTFDSSSYTDVRSLAIQADGKILVGGEFYSVNGTGVGYFARLHPDGSLDMSFSSVVDGVVTAVIAQPGGTVVIGGEFTQVDGEARHGLAHLAIDGTLNPFTGSEIGVDANRGVYTLVQQADGKVLLGGSFTSVEGVLRNYVARLTSSGTPDFFGGWVPVGGGFDYLQFPGGSPFGYYNLAGNGYSFPYLFHADLGLEYFFDAQDGKGGAYLFDFVSGGFFYTSPNFPWPYLYDFSLNTVLYYYPDPNTPGRYNTDGYRFFYRFDTGQIIVK